MYVDQVALAPSYRGRGVGSILYSELERWDVRQLCRSLNCEVNLDPPNPGSLAFHRSYGFIEIGRMHTSAGRHVALLQKEVGKRKNPAKRDAYGEPLAIGTRLEIDRETDTV